MKLRHIIIIAVFILINGLIGMTLLRGLKTNTKDKDKKFTVVFPTLVAKQVHNIEESFNITAYGEVTAYNSIDISAEVQGKLIKGKVELKLGVKFRKGDLLFKIKDTEAIYNIRARKSTFINMIASILPDINSDFPDEFDKWNNYINNIKLNQTLPILPSWTSNKEKVFLSNRKILSEYFSIKSAEEQLAKYYVYAPFSGTIKNVFINEYSIVNPGVKVMTIVQTSNYELPIAIPLEQANTIKIGAQANIYTTSGELIATGKVIRISDVLNKQTQSITAFVKPKVLKNKQIVEGEYLKAELDLGSTFKGFRIPYHAISDNAIVYIYQADSTLKPKNIQVLNENDKGIFVSGLNDGETVIVQEVFNYTDTSKFKVILK
jgi:multidrug efflux pump subunit AcrA (membrane-fusion protein)